MSILCGESITYTKDPFAIQFVDLQELRVTWIDGMTSPLQTIGNLTEGYNGIYDPSKVSMEVGLKDVEDLNSTQLKTPFEMIYNIFLIQDVTRSFTHQMVRTRHASYIQESMRFIGHKNMYRVLVGNNILKNNFAFDLYIQSCTEDIITYEKMMDLGISGEEARDKLPHGILTSLYIGLPLNSLQHMYAQRMCCQAQPGQWQIVMKKIKEELTRVYGKEVGNLLTAPYERGESCGYRASFDRPCTWQKNEK
jgi:thymidylate synthase ThyX